jgi:hypothetical protein
VSPCLALRLFSASAALIDGKRWKDKEQPETFIFKLNYSSMLCGQGEAALTLVTAFIK